MTTAAPQTDSRVPPVLASIKMQVLPKVAVKIALGAAYEVGDDGVKVSFEEDLFALHPRDFEIAKKAADRLKSELPEPLTATGFLDTCDRAQKYVAEEVFRPGTASLIFYPCMAKGSAFYRGILPALYMNRSDRVTAHVTVKKMAREALWYDVVTIQLDHSKATHGFAKSLKEMGKKVVFEFDDDFESLEPWHPCYEQYRRGETREAISRMLRIADAVTVSTLELANRYRKRTKRIEVLPNTLPLSDWPKAEPHGTDDFRVLWAGSPSHFGDLEVVAQALWRFAKDRKNVKIVFFGREPKLIPDRLRERVIVIPFGAFEEYPHRLADVKADLAIAPLADNRFNGAKSHVKLLEYGATGYPIVASDVGPYAAACEEAKDAPPASLCRTEEGWFNALKVAYENESLIKGMAENSLAYARRYDVEAHVGRFEDFYRSF